jgi:hypothetical protein
MNRLATGSMLALVGSLVACAALALQFATRAAATAGPRPPLATTGTFPLVSTSSATLKGGVNARGTETTYAFQYGLTTAYGAQTSAVPAGNGTAEIKVSQSITGLQRHTTYHCRLIATNAAGTTIGQDVAFTTKKIPLTFTIAATPNPVVFGNAFSVKGVVSGTDAPGQRIVLQQKPFPYLAGFKDTGPPGLTAADASFSLPVGNLVENTQFRVATVNAPTVQSTVVLERVAVRVSLHVRATGRHGFVRMYGSVEPDVTGAPVTFQLLRRGFQPYAVGRTVLRRATATASRFSRVVRIHHEGLYRTLVQVSNGRQISGRSRAILIR